MNSGFLIYRGKGLEAKFPLQLKIKEVFAGQISPSGGEPCFATLWA